MQTKIENQSSPSFVKATLWLALEAKWWQETRSESTEYSLATRQTWREKARSERVQRTQSNNNWKRAHLSNTHQGSRWPEKVARTIQFAKLPWRALAALAHIKARGALAAAAETAAAENALWKEHLGERLCLCAPGEKTVKESEWAIKSCSREREEVKRKWAHKLNAQFCCRVQRLTQTWFLHWEERRRRKFYGKYGAVFAVQLAIARVYIELMRWAGKTMLEI